MRSFVCLLLCLFLAAALALPAAGADGGGRVVQSGDTIYIGEEDLDLTPLFAGSPPSPAGMNRLVHSGDPENIIDVPDPGRFDLTPVAVGGVTGSYAVLPQGGAPGRQVAVAEPLRLRVVSNGSPSESVNGMVLTENRTIDLVLVHNLSGVSARIDLVGPEGGLLPSFGGVNLTAIPVTASPVVIGGIDLAGVPPGFYAARARVPSPNATYLSNTVVVGVVPS
ncbi:hypothetical protein ABH15_03195 [Methanoculleus taiwanensis]|uniref:DUF3821 domain-containing protein n=1 Tax=Methanoculleus taiwanensis TaxID=1550565 RepID=A0A498H287_9EURY|nr:DUF3821 domain-containing protein [Methanoculleus taiwanensis]RXE57141.1 hypothetical protein ABH15_03195 [Methanoculleus taiwanensis]